MTPLVCTTAPFEEVVAAAFDRARNRCWIVSKQEVIRAANGWAILTWRQGVLSVNPLVTTVNVVVRRNVAGYPNFSSGQQSSILYSHLRKQERIVKRVVSKAIISPRNPSVPCRLHVGFKHQNVMVGS